ncbi:hypothetical protein [Kocuria sp. CPCC 204721]|uniref:hypothetical protein n=1 Tax=Kocuria sp. CPCC 204721 TaxID=3073548 RepID=UPI0034D5ECAC
MKEYDVHSESTIEWASLIRYQLLVAQEQSTQPAPLSVLAINTMQDATESALSLVVQEKGGDMKARPDFMQLFDAAITHGVDESGLRAFRPAIQAMNNARVSFKHHGNSPAEGTIRRHWERTNDFVRELFKQVLDIELNEVSLLVFIKNEYVRSHLRDAQEAWGAGKQDASTEALRLAFDTLIKDYTNRKVWHPGKSLFTTKPSFYPSRRDIKYAGLEKIDEWLDNIDKWVRHTALGVDMRRFAYFDAHTPSISYALGGNHFTNHREAIQIDEEVFSRCFRFVVDTALALGRDDFDFDLWTARQATSRTDQLADDATSTNGAAPGEQ